MKSRQVASGAPGLLLWFGGGRLPLESLLKQHVACARVAHFSSRQAAGKPEETTVQNDKARAKGACRRASP
jgi:hypothetical protein